MSEYWTVDKEAAVTMILSTFLGERCKFCGAVFETLDDLEDAVWAGYHQYGRLAHRSCWEEHKEAQE